jgi:hypothetical protein
MEMEDFLPADAPYNGEGPTLSRSAAPSHKTICKEIHTQLENNKRAKDQLDTFSFFDACQKAGVFLWGMAIQHKT